MVAGLSLLLIFRRKRYNILVVVVHHGRDASSDRSWYGGNVNALVIGNGSMPTLKLLVFHQGRQVQGN